MVSGFLALLSLVFMGGCRLAVWLGLRSGWLGLRHGWLGLRPGWLVLGPGWLGLRPGWMAQREGGRTEERTDVRKILPFYRTLSPIGAVAHKGRRGKEKGGEARGGEWTDGRTDE